MEGRSRKRFLSEEEIELWARVTRNDEPLARPQPLCLTDSRPRETGTPAGPRRRMALKRPLRRSRPLPLPG